MSVLWHARVSRCRTAAELAVHIRSVNAVLDAEFVAEAVGDSGVSGERGSGRGWGTGGEQITVLSERYDEEAGEIEVQLRVLPATRKVYKFKKKRNQHHSVSVG